jgi:glutamate N-acetyltransferase/amino-acid N-acetyltransferase
MTRTPNPAAQDEPNAASTHAPSVAGFRFGAFAAGIKKGGALDLALAVMEGPGAAAGLFTQNAVRAAPVELCVERLRKGRAQAVLVNAGCANACTGSEGMDDARAMAHAAAAHLGAHVRDVLVCSTGVIGLRLPMDRIDAALPSLAATLRADGLADFARAIMTTDTVPKVASASAKVDRKTITVTGVAKGAGMIAPHMATMLGFVFTDAAVSPAFLRAAWRRVVRTTFNAVTIDGDTSTNDSAIVLASGAARNTPITSSASRGATEFEEALRAVAASLAEQIARDGEGATKVIEIRVEGAANDAEAERIARRIAESPLVKTAFYGADPNWGRLACAIGNSSRKVRAKNIHIRFGDVSFVEKGREVPGAERDAREVMKRTRWDVGVVVGRGRGRARMMTCDLTEKYIEINAHYRS